MYRIVRKEALKPTVILYEIEAPMVAKKAEPGQFIILRVDENGERIPITIHDYDREKGTVTIFVQTVGATTEKLKYGHRGANHPVRDIDEGRVYITSQNHGYVVKAESVNPEIATVSHINVNDGTVEGLKYKNGRIFTVQFHPEASPGPRDTGYLFDRFIEKMEAKKHAEE